MRILTLLLFLGVVCCTIAFSLNYYLGQDETVSFPRIKDFGVVNLMPEAMHQPRRGAKVVMDITAGSKDDELNRGLERAARLLNLYASAGVPDRNVQVSLVLHGEATRAGLNDEAYASRYKTRANPSRVLVKALKDAGVEMFVCGHAMHNKKIGNDEILPEFAVAVAALTVVINKQTEGYVLINAP